MFSSKGFIVSSLTFRSLIHFELIFVYCVRVLPALPIEETVFSPLYVLISFMEETYTSLIFLFPPLVEEIVNKMKRQPTEWETIFSIDVTDNGSISKIYKLFIQLNIKNNKK